MSENWIETASGLQFHFPPKTGEISIYDIAHQLANQCRFNGACREFYSVAQHSVLVARLLEASGASPRIQLLGLLHDAHEAYLGDLVRPLKALMRESCQQLCLEKLSNATQLAIYAHANIAPPTAGEWECVKTADEMMLATEAVALMSSRGTTWGGPHQGRWECHLPESHPAYPSILWSPFRARDGFIFWWKRLDGGRANAN